MIGSEDPALPSKLQYHGTHEYQLYLQDFVLEPNGTFPAIMREQMNKGKLLVLKFWGSICNSMDTVPIRALKLETVTWKLETRNLVTRSKYEKIKIVFGLP